MKRSWRKRFSAFLGRRLGKTLRPKRSTAANIGIPIRDGQETTTQANSGPAQASAQADGPSADAIVQKSKTKAQTSNKSDGTQVVDATQTPTVTIPTPTHIDNYPCTTAQEPIRPAYQSVEHDRSSDNVGHQVTSSFTASVATASTNNDAREAVADTTEPPRLNRWKNAVDRLKASKPEVYQRLETMEQLIKEKEKSFTLQEPPKLLELLKSQKRKAGGIPEWVQSVFRSILAVKDVFTVVANFDPYHAAPVVWKGFCVILEALVNDATLLEDSDLNVNDVTSKIKHWANIEMFYMGTSSRATVDRFKGLEIDLINLYTAILEFEVEVFRWCDHGLLVQVVLSPERKERWKSMISKIKTYHEICSSTFGDCKTTSEQHKKILRWISTYRAEVTHDDILERTQVDEKYPNCGEWLINSDKFKKWSSVDPKPTRSVFWLRGTLGTGKTTLLCRIIEWHLDRRSLYPDRRFAFFYCTGAKESKTQYQTALLAILCQAAFDVTSGTVSRNVLDAYYEANPDPDNPKPLHFRKSQYQELLGGILKSGVRLRIMIDALDQCDKPEELLKVLRDVPHQSPGRLELLVSSQDYVQVEDKFPDVEEVYVNTSMPKDDMVTYITAEVKGREKDERLLKGQEEELEDELIQLLIEKAGNMFRWVELQLGYFLGPGRTILKEQVKQDLKKLKEGPVANEKVLYATYDDLFERNTRDGGLDRDKAIKIYKMLLCCNVSLSPFALSQALALNDIKPWYQSISDSEIIIQLTRDFPYVTRSDKLDFAHKSAIEYLQIHRADHQDYSDAVCEAEMALICIKCISSRDTPPFLPDTMFAWYAENFWVEHCALLNREERESLEVSKTLLAWLVKDTDNTIVPEHPRGRGIPNIKMAMLLASICNFVEIGEKIILSRSHKHESLSDLFSRENREEFSHGLYHYTKGFFLSVVTSDHLTPLEWAAVCGSEDMVELLLKHDKQAYAAENMEPTPLALAARYGQEAMVRKFLLLKYRFDCNLASSGSGRTPLSFAAEGGHLGIVQLLFEFGADPEIPDYTGRTPLFHAVEHGHVTIVEFLVLQKKVEFDSKDYAEQTPLAYAVEENRLKVAQLLLEFGADPEQECDRGQTPLSYAREGNDQKMIQLLESYASQSEEDDSDVS